VIGINILFLTNDELSDLRSSGIFSDLLREFALHGHSVYAVCANERRLGRETELRQECGINVLRVKTGNITQVNVIEKGISTLLVGHQFKMAIKKHLPRIKFDLVLYSTPPITLLSVIEFVKRRDGAATYLLLKDIFPQNAVDIGLIKDNGLVHRYFRTIEKRFYQISDYIGCMSEGNCEYLLENNPEVDPAIVEVCPNSIKPFEVAMNAEQQGEIRRKFQIPLDKTVFIYGGNLGKPQGIDFLAECLEANGSNDKVHFVIAGSGTEFGRLKSFIDGKTLANVQMFTKIPKCDYEMLVSACDVGLIFLDHRFTIPNFPSRLLSYMNASIPILAATDVNTDLGTVITKGQFGFWCESGNVEEFCIMMNRLCDPELRYQMGHNARRFLEQHYTVEGSYETIMKHF